MNVMLTYFFTNLKQLLYFILNKILFSFFIISYILVLIFLMYKTLSFLSYGFNLPFFFIRCKLIELVFGYLSRPSSLMV